MPPSQSPMGYQPQAPQGPPPQYRAASSKSPFNPLIIVCAVLALALVGSLIFAFWAFSERGTYKNKTDEVVAKEVVTAKQQVSDEKDKEFVEKEKFPLQEYKGPATYGSVSVMYPKTWSAYVDLTNGQTPVNGYFHPDFVPATGSGTAFALRVEVVNTPYAQEVKDYDARVKSGKVKVSPFKAPKVAGTDGSRLEGEINQGQKGTMVIFPLRDKTLKISTQTDAFLKDFNEIILANLTFVP